MNSAGDDQPHLLVVDDDPGLLRLIRRTLGRAGFRTEGAGGGSEALDKLENGNFHLILLDFQLPDMAARELVDVIRRKKLLVPFVVVTGQGDERVAVDMMKRGARDYIVKDQHLLDRLVPVVQRIMQQLEQERRLRETERALREKANLARLGEMAAVVAHEVKNPLAAISGALQVIRGQMGEESAHGKIIDEILGRVESLNNSVDEMLLFARPQLPGSSPVPIRGLLEESVSLLFQDRAFERIDITVSGDDHVVRGDAALLKRAFLNLLINAAQAVEGKGKVGLEITRDAERCRVAVSDSGPGIPSGAEQEVLQPFYTTKARGTGLGLPTARRIVESHEGTLLLAPSPSGGARVVVELPLFDGAAPGGAGPSR